MSTETLNALATSSSSYLRSAMHQPVWWHEWSPEAFRLAAQQDKPILLDIGAVWCHWCHVMDRESYEHEATAALINKSFIAIKVDRDDRPDVDTRYQAAVSAISGQGGWPLTAFLTPDGKPFFGGTYFPPEDRYGRPSFQRVLQTMADSFRERRDEVNDSADSVMHAIEFNESFSGREENLSSALLDKLVEPMLQQFDSQHGGFGSQPKFPHAGALTLLLDVAARQGIYADAAGHTVRVTLEKMARSGLRDQLGGGFHRYSVDERWVVPHFEKMAYDNAEMLKIYSRAFRTFVLPEFAECARATMRWMDEVLSDRERGGFYSSQDADLNLHDDGDYFTWTRDEAAAELTADELAVASVYFDIGEIGDMHHDPSRNVVHVRFTVEEVARQTRMGNLEVERLIASATTKLREAREKRRTPFVDRTLYTGWNGLCISAYFDAARTLRSADALDFATRSLDRMLREAWSMETGLSHAIAYSDGSSGGHVNGVLEDYAFAGLACLDAWEALADARYLESAIAIAERMVKNFADLPGGGFFDIAHGEGAEALGALMARRKPLQDAPTPAGNSAAALFLIRVAHWAEREDLRKIAGDTLQSFGGIVEHFGLYAASFGLALQAYLKPPVQVVVLGPAHMTGELEAASLAGYAVNKSVLHFADADANTLPTMLRETLGGFPRTEEAAALVCGGGHCLAPISDADKLVLAVAELAD